MSLPSGTYVKKGGKITASNNANDPTDFYWTGDAKQSNYIAGDTGKVEAVTLKPAGGIAGDLQADGTGADMFVRLANVDKVTGSKFDDVVVLKTVPDKAFGALTLGQGTDAVILTDNNGLDTPTEYRLKLSGVEIVKAASGDAGDVSLDINGTTTFSTNGSVNFTTSLNATAAKQTITYTHMVADTTVDLALGKDLIIFEAGTTFSIIDGNLVASHPDETGSVTFQNYASTASNLKITVGDVTKTYAEWYADSDEYSATAITLSAIDISDQETNTAPGSNAGDTVDDFVTNVDEQTITVQLSRALVNGEQLLGSIDGGTTWTVVETISEGLTAQWDVTLTEGTDDIVFKVRAPNGDYLPVDGEGGESLSQTYTLDQTAPDIGNLSFDSITSDSDDPDTTDAVTNQTNGSVTFSYDGANLGTGERFQYSIDGGTTWLESVSGEGTTITVDGEGSVTLDEINFTTVSDLRLRVIDEAGNESTNDDGSFISKEITYDNTAPTWGEGSNTLSLDEKSTDDISLSITATDTNGVTYSLVADVSDNNDYSIDEDTGALTRSSAANYEDPNTSDTVTVTATDDAGNTTTQVFTINIGNVDEAGTLTISGSDNVQGTTLTANLTDIDGATSNESYQWYRDGVAIDGATGSTYTLGLDDIGAQIDVEVYYDDPQGTGKYASSSSTETVDALADQALTVSQAAQYADAINNDHSDTELYMHDDTEHGQGSFYVQDSAANVVAASKATLDKISADDGNLSDLGEDGNEIVIYNHADPDYGAQHDITMAQMDALLNKGVVTANDGALQAKDVFYDIYDFYTSVQAGQSTQQGQSIIANADTVTAYGNAVGQQIDMLAFDRDLIIYGRAGADTIYTGTGDNFVTGGSEADVIIGDIGDDIIFAGELDQDITRASLEYGRLMLNEERTAILGGDLSQVSFLGTGGGSLGEDIHGDTLNGGAGNDYLYGDGSDTNDVNGNGKVDVLHGNGGDDVLVVEGGWNVTGEDQAYGDAGNDILIHSGWGYAELHGGTGNDVYYVQGGWSSVYENADEGIDTVVVDGDSWWLEANVENLTNLSDFGNAYLQGNELGNVITSSGAADTLYGADGSDTFITGGGADTVTLGEDSSTDYVVYQVSDTIEQNFQLVTDAPTRGWDSGYDLIKDLVDGSENDKLVFDGFTVGTGRQLDGTVTSQTSAALDANKAISATASLLVVTDSAVSDADDVSGAIATALGSAFNLSSLDFMEAMLFSVKASDIDDDVNTDQYWVGIYNNGGVDDGAHGDEIQIVGLVSISGGGVDYDNFVLSVPAIG